MTTVREAAVRGMPPDTDNSERGRNTSMNEVAK